MSKKKKQKLQQALQNVKSSLTAQEKTAAWGKMFSKTVENFQKRTKDGKTVAMDASVCQKFQDYYAPNMELDATLYEYMQRGVFIGYQACAMLMTNWLISKACRLPPEDALAPDFRIVLEQDSDKETQEKGEELKELRYLADKKYNIIPQTLKYLVNNRTFGVAYALPIVDGIDYSAPFNIDGVKSGSYKGMRIIDPIWLIPEFNLSAVSKPDDKGFYEPTYYQMMNGQRIHASHVIKCIYAPVPDILKPSFYFGGVPLTQMIYRRVFSAESLADEATMLAKSKRMLIIDGDLASYIENEAEMQVMLEKVADLRDNKGMFFKNPDDDVKQIDTSLTDLPEVMAGQYQLVASTAQMTYEKLMGTAPKGMNASGEFSYKDYVQTLQGIQELQATPLIERHCLLSLKSDFGKTYKFNIVFNPIDSPTSKEIAEVSAIRANTLATLQASGAISTDEMRDVIRQDEHLGLNNISDNIDQSEVQEQETNGDRTVQKDGQKFRMRNPAISPTLQQKEKIKVKASDSACEDGGEGSGDFNHKGRKGEVGGSAPKEKKDRLTTSENASEKEDDHDFVVVERGTDEIRLKNKEDGVKFWVNKDEWDDQKKRLSKSGVAKYRRAKNKLI